MTWRTLSRVLDRLVEDFPCISEFIDHIVIEKELFAVNEERLVNNLAVQILEHAGRRFAALGLCRSTAKAGHE